MSFHQYIPSKETASQISIEPIPYNVQANPINGGAINNHSLQYSPTNEQFHPMPPQQIVRQQMVDSSPTSVSHEMFQSPTQLSSQMNRFHLQTPTTDCSPVFSNNNKNSSNNTPVYQTVTPTNSIPRSNQNQYIFSQNAHTTPVMVGQPNMNMSPTANTHMHNQLANQHLVQQHFLMQQQQLMSQNNQFVPSNPMNQNIEHKVAKQVDNDKKVTHSRKPSVTSSVTKPAKPRKASKSKKDSFSSLEDLKASEVYEYDKEITIDDLLKDDPLLELTSPVALEDESHDNSLFSSFVDYEDISQPQPNFVGLGLDLDFSLSEIMNDTSANESTVKSNSNLSLYKRPSTPEQDKLIELFVSPKKKSSSSPKSLSTTSNSPTKFSLDKLFQKPDTFIGTVPRSASNSSINTTPTNKNQPSFSLSECSNTFPVNSNTTNNFSFVIEKKSFSVQSNSNSKLRRKSLPKISQKVNERPSMKKTSSVSDASIVKPNGHPPLAHHHSSSSLVTSPKVLRNMKSGMLLFQLDLNNNGNK